MTLQKKHRFRKQYLINPNFQIRVIVFFIGLSIITTLV